LEKLMEVAQIMKKEFYIIVPFDWVWDESVRDISLIAPFKNFWNSLFKSWVDILDLKLQIRKHANNQKELKSRANSIKIALENIWVKAEELNKNDLVKYLVDYYNPRLDNFTAIKENIDTYNIT
jgi:hypothetical protein